jgi:hypothetical protein
MKTVVGLMLVLGLILATAPATHAADGKVSVVAAENFYGDVARQIGGDDITVASIMSNPDQDPVWSKYWSEASRGFDSAKSLRRGYEKTRHVLISAYGI